MATVEEGGQISLHCTGMPVVEFIWYINGSKIANKENSHINPFGTLVLSNIKRPDAGMYVCAATNKKGFAFSTVSLNVGRKLNHI